MMNVEEIISKLKRSPIFNMSLGSKELFHSNFIAWAIESGSVDAASFLNKLCPDAVERSAKLRKVEREKDNLDLRIWFENGQNVVIENKVKSLPDEEQLQKYSEKLKTPRNATCILLSLTKPDFFDKHTYRSSVHGVTWVHASYEDLYNVVTSMTIHDDPYKSDLIKDYGDFIRHLNQLRTACTFTWKNHKELLKYGTQNYKLLKEIRLHDIYEKWRMGEIRKQLEKLCDTRNITFDIGYTHEQGLLDILPENYKSREDYFYSIQIQGNQLRQVLKIKKPKGDLIFEEARKRMEDGPVNQRWFLDSNEKMLPANTDKKAKESQCGFCKFDSTFAYRHESLPDLSRIVDLVKKMESLNAIN